MVRVLVIAGMMGGLVDAVGFAFENYIWCVIGFFLGFYLSGSVYKLGDVPHRKDKRAIHMIALLYVVYNVIYIIYASSTTPQQPLYDRWSWVNAATNYDLHLSFIIKLVIAIAIVCFVLTSAIRLK